MAQYLEDLDLINHLLQDTVEIRLLNRRSLFQMEERTWLVVENGHPIAAPCGTKWRQFTTVLEAFEFALSHRQ